MSPNRSYISRTLHFVFLFSFAALGLFPYVVNENISHKLKYSHKLCKCRSSLYSISFFFRDPVYFKYLREIKSCGRPSYLFSAEFFSSYNGYLFRLCALEAADVLCHFENMMQVKVEGCFSTSYMSALSGTLNCLSSFHSSIYLSTASVTTEIMDDQITSYWNKLFMLRCCNVFQCR